MCVSPVHQMGKLSYRHLCGMIVTLSWRLMNMYSQSKPYLCRFQNTRLPILKCCSHNHQSALLLTQIPTYSWIPNRIILQKESDELCLATHCSISESNFIFTLQADLNGAVVSPTRIRHKGFSALSLAENHVWFLSFTLNHGPSLVVQVDVF